MQRLLPVITEAGAELLIERLLQALQLALQRLDTLYELLGRERHGAGLEHVAVDLGEEVVECLERGVKGRAQLAHGLRRLA